MLGLILGYRDAERHLTWTKTRSFGTKDILCTELVREVIVMTMVLMEFVDLMEHHLKPHLSEGAEN
jgi:hypothetical protein